MAYDIFIIACEPSGDAHGAALLTSLYKLYPKLNVRGVGGPKMCAVGMECFLPMEKFAMMGILDILLSLPKLIYNFIRVKREILVSQPKAVVCIDFPDFNLRLANALYRKHSTAKRIHYICPSVWAWRKGRVITIERVLDQLLTILPFESKYFSQEKLHVSYVGHPTITQIQLHNYDDNWKKQYGISENKQILSIFPGSRKKEWIRNLPLQLHVAKKLQKIYSNLSIAISCCCKKFLSLIDFDNDIYIVDGKHSYELMSSSYISIATSGTVVLELALHHIPTIATYILPVIDRIILQKLFRIHLPYYTLPNLIGQCEIFPELIGPHCTEQALYKKGMEFLHDQHKRIACIKNCQMLRKILGTKNASLKAAHIILDTLSYKKS